jgi:hypothetical protein
MSGWETAYYPPNRSESGCKRIVKETQNDALLVDLAKSNYGSAADTVTGHHCLDAGIM